MTAAALLVGAAVPAALSAQQHQHGGVRADTTHVHADTTRADSADPHRMHTDSEHERMMADSAHHRMMMSDTAHHRMMMQGDSAHHHPMEHDSRSAPPPPPPPAAADSHAGHIGHDASAKSVDPHAGHDANAATPAAGAHAHAEGAPGGHRMLMQPLGDGWSLMGMAQAYPIVTTGLGNESSELSRTEPYLTQPALMINLESPGSAFVPRSTLNFEGITQPGGELTAGGWGQGFIDRRHPHTLLHELMLSANLCNVAGGDLSLSAGKGVRAVRHGRPHVAPGGEIPHEPPPFADPGAVDGQRCLSSGPLER